jgi:4-amino-4-deoxy-L-arabinose transferase-like glycosyltransferase
MTGPELPFGSSRRELAALGLLLTLAAAQGAWNAFTVPPLTGYDAGGHAGYVLTVLREGRLPHPTEGWSTFHPPLYYLLASGVWGALEPASGRVIGAGLRAIGVLAWLVAGLAGYLVVRRLGARPHEAWVASALLLFVPSAQTAAAMVGNEALGAGLAALTLLIVVRLQEDPGNRGLAAAAGLLAGLALATKYTGLWVALACGVPFLRAGADARRLQGLATCGLVVALVAGPVYVRNLALTGSPVPMTRELEPMRSVEALSVIRPRQAADYLWVDPSCVFHPSAFVLTGDPSRPMRIHPATTNVWGVAYASTWWDAFGHRIAPRLERRTKAPAAVLVLLGLVPSGVALLGLLTAAAELVRRRRLTREAPFVAMSAIALATFVAFTLRAPGLSALKGSYLLPLGVPAAVFFMRGLRSLRPRLRLPVLGLSLAAAALAAALLTNGLVFESPSAEPMKRSWLSYARQLPDAHLGEAVRTLVDRY